VRDAFHGAWLCAPTVLIQANECIVQQRSNGVLTRHLNDLDGASPSATAPSGRRHAVPVISTLAPSDDDLPIFDTVAFGKRFVVAIVASADADGGLTEAGARAVEAATAHHRAAHPWMADAWPARAATVRSPEFAAAKAEETLALATDGSLIMLFGPTEPIRAAFRQALRVAPVADHARLARRPYGAARMAAGSASMT
jgi:hypothetical protein